MPTALLFRLETMHRRQVPIDVVGWSAAIGACGGDGAWLGTQLRCDPQARRTFLRVLLIGS